MKIFKSTWNCGFELTWNWRAHFFRQLPVFPEISPGNAHFSNPDFFLSLEVYYSETKRRSHSSLMSIDCLKFLSPGGQFSTKILYSFAFPRKTYGIVSFFRLLSNWKFSKKSWGSWVIFWAWILIQKVRINGDGNFQDLECPHKRDSLKWSKSENLTKKKRKNEKFRSTWNSIF